MIHLSTKRIFFDPISQGRDNVNPKVITIQLLKPIDVHPMY